MDTKTASRFHGWLFRGQLHDVGFGANHMPWLLEHGHSCGMPVESDDVYRDGLIRVGSNRATNTLHFEGHPKHLRNNVQLAKDIAEQLGFDREKLEPRR